MNKPARTIVTRVLLFFLGLVAFLCYIFIYAEGRLHTQFDDAFMYCRYASNFLQGNGFSWNAADGPSHGITSPVYLLLVTCMRYLFTWENSRLLSSISFMAGLSGVLILALAGFQTSQWMKKSWLPLLTVPLVIASRLFRYHSFTGMETTLSFMSNSLLVLFLFIHVKYRRNSSFLATCFVAVFTVLVRPDNGIYALMLPLSYLLVEKAISKKQILLFFSILFSAGILTLLANSFLFGSSVPVPLLVKAGDFYIGYAGTGNWNPVNYILLFIRSTLPFIFIIVFFSTKESRLMLLAVLAPVLLTFLYYFRVIQIMGWFARYYFPSVPFLVMAAYLSVKDRFVDGSTYSCRSLSVRIPVFLAIASASLYSSFSNRLSGIWLSSLHSKPCSAATASYSFPGKETIGQLPWWTAIRAVSSLAGNLPDSASIAATEYGYIAAENMNVTVIDMAGLHDEQLALNGFSSSYILSKRPDLIWMPHWDYTYFVSSLLEDSVFKSEYDYYPRVFNYGIAIRKESQYFTGMLHALEEVFTETYPGKNLSDCIAVFY